MCTVSRLDHIVPFHVPTYPSTDFGQKAFLRESGGGGGVYILRPPATGIYTAPSLIHPPPLEGGEWGV